MKLESYEDAIRDYDEAIKLNDRNDNYWNNRGYSKHQLGRNEDAIKDYS